MNQRWTCHCCGKTIETLPMNYGTLAPANWFGLSEAERLTRAFLNEDICTIDDNEFYVRGRLEIPVLDGPQTMVFGVWVSVSHASFQHILAQWTAKIDENEPPRFGWLCTWLTGYPEPQAIRCHVHLRSGNLRPIIELAPTDNPLSIEQHQGMTLDRVREIAALAFSGPGGSTCGHHVL